MIGNDMIKSEQTMKMIRAMARTKDCEVEDPLTQANKDFPHFCMSSLTRWSSLATVVMFLVCVSCRQAVLLQLGRKMVPFMASMCISQSTADITRLYDNDAQRYDSLDGSEIARKLGLDELRDDLAAKATGKVLEVGAGTGLQLSHYRWSQMRSLTAVDISNGMLAVLKEKVAQLPDDVATKIDVQVGNVEQLSSVKDDEVRSVCSVWIDSAVLQNCCFVCI